MASIRKRGEKWQVQIRRTGHRPISKSFILRKDALEWARDAERQADRGDLPKDGEVLRELTLGDLICRYRDAVSVQKAGYENECIVFNALLQHPICVKTLAELRTEDFAAYRDERLKTIKATTLKRQLNPIHNAFEVARDEWGLPIKANPLDSLALRLKEKARERRLLPGEQERLLAATADRRNKLVAPIIVFALATAMRRGEILAMRWAHVDLHRRSLLIPETKNGDSRVIPLSKHAIAVLELLPRTGERVFPVSANALRLFWTRLTKRAQLKNLHFHDLRHEAISRLFELGLNVPEVALISGHKDLRMLFRYSHAARQRILQQLDRQNTSDYSDIQIPSSKQEELFTIARLPSNLTNPHQGTATEQ
jgi:integrase